MLPYAHKPAGRKPQEERKLAMPYKLDDDGSLALHDDGRPVWINPLTKKESPFDPDAMHAKTIDLGRESKTYREAKETLDGTVAALVAAGVDVENPTEVAAAFKELKKLKAKVPNAQDGGDPEEVSQLREQLHELEEKLTAVSVKAKADAESLETESGKVRKLTVSEAFQRSRYFTRWTDENGEPRDPLTILPPEVAEAYFGGYFEPGEGAEILGFYQPGGDKATLIYSRAEGDSKPAAFDESIERLLERMPNKNDLLPANNPRGSNSSESGGESQGKLTPKQVDSMAHRTYAEMREKGKFPDQP